MGGVGAFKNANASGEKNADPAKSGDSKGSASGGGSGSGGAAAAAGSKVAATERTKTVLACLFEALGARRATHQVARVLCALSAGTAQAAADAAVAHTAASTALRRGQTAGGPGALPAALGAGAVAAPRALLPVLASLPERSADIVGLALEVLETGQAAADSIAHAGGGGEVADGVVVFGSVDSAGR